ncbi:four helix bundle protein [Pseudomonas capsici]|uniref:four helix bundle protein n=1 Tax=Pseudomonas capsici TaxID=2810614 RepID=UPI0021F150B0|nr:four helix bundle protein [Pseudomonas capsici]MCV4343270.1 four helix bundle protein [Pseudomonas capsici]
MAMHTDLDIHKSAEELLFVAIQLVRNIPRDVKQIAGTKITDECLEVLLLIGRANMSRDKRPHLNALLESIQKINYLMRALMNMQAISIPQHGRAMKFSASVGKQANAWKRSSATAPAT